MCWPGGRLLTHRRWRLYADLSELWDICICSSPKAGLGAGGAGHRLRVGEPLEHQWYPLPCLGFPHGITLFRSSEKGYCVDLKDKFWFCMCIKTNNYTMSVSCRLDPTRREEWIFHVLRYHFKNYSSNTMAFQSRWYSKVHFTLCENSKQCQTKYTQRKLF